MNVDIDQPLLLLDGECVLCNGLGLRILHLDRKKKIRMSSLQGQTSESLKRVFPHFPTSIDTIVYIEKGDMHLRSDAVLRMIKHLPFPHYLPIIFLIIPRFIRNFFYDIVARNRKKWFGSTDTCALIPEKDARILP